MSDSTERILDLCRKVGTEHDGKKMTELIRQLNHELDETSGNNGASTSAGKESDGVRSLDAAGSRLRKQ